MISNSEMGNERGRVNLHCWFFETPALYAQLVTADHCRTSNREFVGWIKKNPMRMLFVQNSVNLWCRGTESSSRPIQRQFCHRTRIVMPRARKIVAILFAFACIASAAQPPAGAPTGPVQSRRIATDVSVVVRPHSRAPLLVAGDWA
jgi:hypothetical protein